MGPWLPVNSALCGAVRVVRCAPEDVGKNVMVNVDREGHVLFLDRYHFPGRRNTVTVVLPPPISGATKLYTPTMPETTATFCVPRAL